MEVQRPASATIVGFVHDWAQSGKTPGASWDMVARLCDSGKSTATPQKLPRVAKNL